MAFKKKADSSGDVFKFTNVGDSITGVYLGVTRSEGDYGQSNKYTFRTKTGSKVVFGSKKIDDLLQNEKAGILVRLTFIGTKPTKRGKPMKDFELEIDDEYQASESDLEAANVLNNSNYDEPEDDGEEYEAPTPPAKGAVNSGSPTASARAKAEAMMAAKRRG